MKKITFLIAVALMAMGVHAQHLFINKVDKSVASFAINDIDSITFFKTYRSDQDAKKVIGSLYEAYQLSSMIDVIGISESFSDDAFAGGQRAEDFLTYQHSEGTEFDLFDDGVAALWKRCYLGISISNQYLADDNGIVFSNGAVKMRLKAEAKFFRAYMYWEIVRHFGWAPLFTSVLPTQDDYKAIPQSTPSALYIQVATDLLAALPNLPETVSLTDTCRITKGACQALIARIYLYHTGISQITGLGLTPETWGDGTTTIDKAYVSSQLSDIIANGHYALLPNYSDIWDWSKQQNSEVLLAKHYTNLGMSSWDNLDHVKGNVFTQCVGVRAPDPSTFTSYGYSACVITWDLWDAFGTDSRRSSTIFQASAELSSYQAFYMNTGFFNRKYMLQTKYESKLGGDPPLNWARDIYDIRYSDVLLMAAELNVNGNGLAYFNAVHQRAGNAAVVSIDQTAILQERRLEFGGEGLRKWDLLRTGLTYAQTQCEHSFTNLPAYLPNMADFTGRVFHQDSWGMLPIPSVEISKANPGVLKQMVPYYILKAAL